MPRQFAKCPTRWAIPEMPGRCRALREVPNAAGISRNACHLIQALREIPKWSGNTRNDRMISSDVISNVMEGTLHRILFTGLLFMLAYIIAGLFFLMKIMIKLIDMTVKNE